MRRSYEDARPPTSPVRVGHTPRYQIVDRVPRALLLLTVAAGGLIVLACSFATPQAAPGPSGSPTAPVAATTLPGESAVPIAVAPMQLVVYYVRDAVALRGSATGSVPVGRDSADTRIGARLSALWGTQPPPPGASNPFFKSGRTGNRGQLGTSIRVEGDLATVTFDLPGGWGVTSEGESRAVYQQLVYTITEEPGIRRALIKETGRADAVIGTLTITEPATREDVMGYSFSGAKTPSIVNLGTQMPAELTDVGVAVDTDILTRSFVRGYDGLARVGIDLRSTASPPDAHFDPRFTATLERCDPPTCDGGKWTLAVTLPDAKWPAGRPAYVDTFDHGPIRSVRAAEFQGGMVVVAIRLDDARPWRVATEPTGPGTARVYIDVGGRPTSVNENIAVYLPVPEQGAGDRATGCTCRVEGAARVFEASVLWRVFDGSGREVARGNTTATRGTSAVWGTFATTVTVPPAVVGQATIEVFWLSPRDGSAQDVVRLPVTLH